MTSIILAIIDDAGKELYAGAGYGGTNLAGAGTYGLPTLPVFQSLVASGVLFTNFRVQQLCSPTRAAIQTGRNPARTGVTDILRDDGDVSSSQPPLRESEATLAKCLKEQGFATACFGKWHLGNVNNGGREHPNRCGFDVYAGNLFNLANSNFHTVNGDRKREGFYAWDMTLAAKPSVCTAFHTTQLVNMAKRWWKDNAGDKFLYLPFFGAHSPFVNNSALSPIAVNSPPTSLYDSATWSAATNTTLSTQATMHAFRAHVEAVDTELGRLLASVDLSDTIVIFLSDNGSPVTTMDNEVHPTLGAYTTGRGKDSPYETGIWSPLVISGPGISSGIRYEKLASAADLYPTILELAGCPLPEDVTLDGVSLIAPLGGSTAAVRTSSFSQWAQPTGYGLDRTVVEWAMVGDSDASGRGRYKLIQPSIGGTREFYDLFPDGTNYNPMEATNLTPSGSTSSLTAGQRAAHTAITAAYESLRADGGAS